MTYEDAITELAAKYFSALPDGLKAAFAQDMAKMIETAIHAGLRTSHETDLEEMTRLNLCEPCGRKLRDWANTLDEDGDGQVSP